MASSISCRPLFLSTAAILLFAATAGVAQTRSGFEFGLSQDKQSGSFKCVCGTAYSGGSGSGWNINAFWEFPVSRNFFGGLGFGFDRKATRTSNPETPGLFFTQEQGHDTVTTLLASEEYSLSESFLRIQPYLQSYLFNSRIFLQVGLGASVLVSHTASQSLQLNATGITFPNGSNTQTVDGTAGTLNTWQFSTFGAAGYDLSLFGATISPMVTFELPFNNVSSEYASNWKISSIYGSIKFSFAP